MVSAKFMRGQWASFHLYRAGPLDPFLRDAVAPFVKAVLAERLASVFFFVRYWERGAHIRLRFRTTAEEELGRRVRAYFESYFETDPSMYPDGRPVDLLDDCVREVAYEPETARYGGTKGVVVSERQFAASSRAVLAAMSGRAWSYESAIGAAVQLHMMFASVMGFEPGAAAKFFATVSDGFGKTTGWLPPGVTAVEAIRQFARLFELQRERLVTNCRDVWTAVREAERFEQRWANRWVRDSLDVARCLRRARRLLEAEPWPAAEQAIMMSYVHMTNNRLGVMNRDEAYVAYLLMRAFQEAA